MKMTSSRSSKETSSAMLRPRIFLLVFVNLFNLFNCRERSDWSYDRETHIASRTAANGTTYSCKAWDIIDPIMSKQQLDLDNQPCLLNSSLSANDPSCISTKVISILSNVMSSTVNHSCVAPIPSLEEVFETVEKIYRSSLNESPVSKEWIIQVAQNISKIQVSINDSDGAVSRNGTNRAFRVESLKNACKLVLIALVLNTTDLPKLRDEVSALESVLSDAKLRDCVLELESGGAPPESRTDDDVREELLSVEIMALKDSYEFELTTWQLVEQMRSRIVETHATKMRREHEMASVKRNIVEARMNMLSKMAEANEMLAKIESSMREVGYFMSLAQPVVDDKSETED